MIYPLRRWRRPRVNIHVCGYKACEEFLGKKLKRGPRGAGGPGRSRDPPHASRCQLGRSAAPVETAPAPAVVVSKEEEDLVARARALLSDAEPAPAPTRVEPVEDDDLDIDMDLIRRARALRGASQLARTESK